MRFLKFLLFLRSDEHCARVQIGRLWIKRILRWLSIVSLGFFFFTNHLQNQVEEQGKIQMQNFVEAVDRVRGDWRVEKICEGIKFFSRGLSGRGKEVDLIRATDPHDAHRFILKILSILDKYNTACTYFAMIGIYFSVRWLYADAVTTQSIKSFKRNLILSFLGAWILYLTLNRYTPEILAWLWNL